MLPIALPAPTFRRADGELDGTANSRYAELVRATWIRNVIVAGPVGLGEECTPHERADLAAIWQDHADQLDLVLGCWHPNDYRVAAKYGQRPLAILRANSADQLARRIEALPPNAIGYANPRYSQALISPDVLRTAARRTDLPSAMKLSKVTLDQITRIRTAFPHLELWHGSSRHIAASLDAGADVVVAPPLAALPQPWPQLSIGAVQQAVNHVQRLLDAQPDHAGRVRTVTDLATHQLAIT